MSTLDDLKRAIDSFQAELNQPRGDDGYDLQLYRAKAWRTYAKYLETWVHCLGTGCTCQANEAHQLVKDKLS